MNMNTKDIAMQKIVEDFNIISNLTLQQLDLQILLLKNNNQNKQLSVNKIKENEILIDSHELTINDKAINLIVLHHPLAGELRKIISCMRISGFLERISDLSLNITEFIEKTDNKETLFQYSESLLEMMKISNNMVQKAISSFDTKNISEAKNVILTDDKVDNLNKEISKKIIKPKENSNYEINSLICINNITSNIERIADNATNIAESVIYMLQGKDVRHKTK